MTKTKKKPLFDIDLAGIEKSLRGRKVATLTVSLPAIMARINRKLAHENRQLRAARGARMRSNLGNYYVVDRSRNVIVGDLPVGLDAMARKLGVLQPWEVLEEVCAKA